ATSTKQPSFRHTCTGVFPAASFTASRITCTPCRLLSKQSHNSPVVVTAHTSAAGICPINVRSACGNRAGSFHRAKGTLRAWPLTWAALRFAPPMSRPRTAAMPALRLHEFPKTDDAQQRRDWPEQQHKDERVRPGNRDAPHHAHDAKEG